MKEEWKYHEKGGHQENYSWTKADETFKSREVRGSVQNAIYKGIYRHGGNNSLQ